MDYRTVAWALAVALLAVIGAFWAVIEERDQRLLNQLRDDYKFLRDRHLIMRDRMDEIEEEIAEIQGEDSAEDSARYSSPSD